MNWKSLNSNSLSNILLTDRDSNRMNICVDKLAWKKGRVVATSSSIWWNGWSSELKIDSELNIVQTNNSWSSIIDYHDVRTMSARALILRCSRYEKLISGTWVQRRGSHYLQAYPNCAATGSASVSMPVTSSSKSSGSRMVLSLWQVLNLPLVFRVSI